MNVLPLEVSRYISFFFVSIMDLYNKYNVQWVPLNITLGASTIYDLIGLEELVLDVVLLSPSLPSPPGLG